MSTKRMGVSCYDKAGIDEPLFVLRAQDALAVSAVLHWAHEAEIEGTSRETIAEARKVAAEMAAWPTKKIPD